MAEGKDFGLKDLEKEITCGICHQHYQEPKVLSCCHYYCKQCIHRLALRTGLDKPFSCPECRKDTILSQGKVDSLQAAFFVNYLKQVHYNFQRATGEVETECELCSEDKATAFCRQCAKFVCVECVRSHQRMKIAFSDHKIATLEELKEGGADGIIIPEPTQFCKKHEQKMKLFCIDCGCLICRDCAMKDHHGHKCQSVKKAASEVKKELSQHLQPLRVIKEGLLCAVNEVRITRSELETEGRAVVGQIENWCDKLCKIIRDRKEQLVAEVESKIARKSKHLADQEKGISISCAGADSVIKYTQHCVERLTDNKILRMKSHLQGRIEREKQKHKKAGNSLSPVEEVDVAVEVGGAEELKEIIQSKTRITQSPPEYTVIWNGSNQAVASEGSEVEVTVCAKLANGKPVKRKPVIGCLLKRPNGKQSYTCVLRHIRDGKYLIQYSPPYSGSYELILTLNGVVYSTFHLSSADWFYSLAMRTPLGYFL